MSDKEVNTKLEELERNTDLFEQLIGVARNGHVGHPPHHLTLLHQVR